MAEDEGKMKEELLSFYKQKLEEEIKARNSQLIQDSPKLSYNELMACKERLRQKESEVLDKERLITDLKQQLLTLTGSTDIQ